MGLMHVVLRGRLRELPNPTVAPAAWEAFWRRHPGAWAGLIAKFIEQAAADPAAFLAAAGAGPDAAGAEGLGEVHDVAAPDAAGPDGADPEVAAADGADPDVAAVDVAAARAVVAGGAAAVMPPPAGPFPYLEA